jgi:hypothetical protein
MVLGLLAAPAATVAAGNTSPATAELLETEQTGALAGGPGGHFAYYRFSYPGGWPVQLELIPYTADKNVLQYVGLKVYGPEPGREYVDAKLDDGVWRGTVELFVPRGGDYLVQVCNYSRDVPIDYLLWVTEPD